MDTASTNTTGHASADHAEEMKKHIRQYWMVFIALGCLTLITVAVSYLKLNRPLAITIALIIASVKASLVAAVFMHLISEKKVIYAVLVLTAAFFLLVLLLPVITVGESSAL